MSIPGVPTFATLLAGDEPLSLFDTAFDSVESWVTTYFAAVGGSASTQFLVANATPGSNGAVNILQADARYAALAGDSAQPFLVKDATAPQHAPSLTQVQGLIAGTSGVTSLSIASAHGFAGTASIGSTPILTITTSVNGIVQGDGTSLSAATTTGSGSVVLAASPTLSGTPVGPTASVSTNSTQLATTAFVWSLGLSTIVAPQVYSADTTLTSAAFGKLSVHNSASAHTFILPAASSGTAGRAILLSNTSTGALIIAMAGADTFYAKGAVNSVGSIGIFRGETITLVTDGSGSWYQADGTAYDVYAGNISASNSLLVGSGGVSSSGQITSTATTGTAPFVIASTTLVPNLTTGGNALLAGASTQDFAVKALTAAGNAAIGGSAISPWQTASSGTAAIQMGKVSFAAVADAVAIGNNTYRDAVGPKAIATGVGTRYIMNAGSHLFQYAASVVADAAQSFVNLMALDSNGNLVVTGNQSARTVPVHANNAAAITGGLIAGDFYRTGADPDPLCIVH